MKLIELSTAKKTLSEYEEELKKGTIIFTSQKKPVAALVSLNGIEEESFALSMNPDFIGIIENSRKELKEGKKLSLEEMKQEFAS